MILRLLLAALLCLSPSAALPWWQSVAQQSVGGAPAAPTYTAGAATTSLTNGFSAGTKTITNLNGGVNFPAGAKVYAFVGQNQGATIIGSPVLGGVAATLVTGSQDSSTKCQFYFSTMAGAAADTFTFDGNTIDQITVVAAYMTNVTAAPTDSKNLTFGSSSQPVTPSAATTVPSTGFGVAGVYGSSALLVNGTNTPTWTNTTAGAGDINVNPASGSQQQALLAHTATSGSWAPTASTSPVGLSFISCMSSIAVGP